jgi:hypothetical protein
MDHGHIVSEGAPDALVERHVGRNVLEVATDAIRRAGADQARVRPFGAGVEPVGRGRVYARNGADMPGMLGR